jgi:hydroxyquinol 1,2-dioxygenase
MADASGLYAVQDPEIDQQNLRGVYTTAADGSYELAAIRPTPYPIPTDGPVGELLGATARHPWRPGHLHFRVSAPGHVPVTMHVFEQTSAYLDSDAVFGVRDSLIVPFAPQPDGVYRADFDFVLSPA